MQGKDKLLEELFPNLTISSNFVFEKFTNEESEKEFFNFETEKYKLGTIVICLLVTCLNIYNVISTWLGLKIIGLTIGYSIYWLLDLAIFVSLFQLKLSDSFNLKLRIFKFVINTLYSVSFIFIVIVYEEKDKELDISRSLFVHCLVLTAEYVYLIRNSSKLLYYFMMMSFISSLIIATFTIYEIHIELNGDYPIYLDASCNRIVDYKKFINNKKINITENIVKGINTTVHNSAIISNREVGYIVNIMKSMTSATNSTLNDNESIVPTKQDTPSLSDIDINSNATPTPSTFEKDFQLNNETLYMMIPEFIKRVINGNEHSLNCFVYHYSNIFEQPPIISAIYLGMDIKASKDVIAFRVEIISCLFCPFLFYLTNLLSRYRRQIFIKIKQTEVLMNYFDHLISNMHCQVVSMTKDKILFCNKAFTAAFKEILEKSKESHNQIQEERIDTLNDKKPTEVVKLFSFKSESSSSQNINDYLEKPSSLKCYFSHLLLESNEFAFKNSKEKENLYQILEHIKGEMGITSTDANTNNISLEVKEFKHLKRESLSSCNPLLELINILGPDFKLLGTFSFKNTGFYNVYIRKQSFKEYRFILDIMFDDITEIKKAEKISFETKLKQKLFSKMAHEFKTPLIIIKSLVSEPTTEDIKEKELRSKYIYYISDYITFLINDIIFYTNNSEIKVVKEVVEINELLKFCEGVTKSLIAVMPGNKKNISVCSKSSSNINDYFIVSDKTRLKQVLLNFISNAVKFTKCGEIQIIASIDENYYDEAVENQYEQLLKLKVVDTGIGISEKDLENIRKSSDKVLSINTEYEYNQMGTGLGIGISKSIIHKLGYKFFVMSQLGIGSEFTILINNPIKKDKKSSSETSFSDITKSINYSYMPNRLFNDTSYNQNKNPNGKAFKKSTAKSNVSNINSNKEKTKFVSFGDYFHNSKSESPIRKSEVIDGNEYNLSSEAINYKNKLMSLISPIKNNIINNKNESFSNSNMKNINKISPLSKKTKDSVNFSSMNNKCIIKYSHRKSSFDLAFNINNDQTKSKLRLLSQNRLDPSKINTKNNYNNRNNTHEIDSPLKSSNNEKESIFRKITPRRSMTSTLRKILVVDDTDTIRLSVKRLLESNLTIKNNFNIIEAKDGIEMLNYIINDQFEGNMIKLVITDENMEYMSGSTAIQILRSLEQEKKVKRTFIVSLTAFNDEETINNIYKKGADEILSKPLSNTVLNEFVRNNLKNIIN